MSRCCQITAHLLECGLINVRENNGSTSGRERHCRFRCEAYARARSGNKGDLSGEIVGKAHASDPLLLQINDSRPAAICGSRIVRSYCLIVRGGSDMCAIVESVHYL
jgi:hypothetical protein